MSSREGTLELALDVCIDTMLTGGDWREVARRDADGGELQGLMTVAEGLVELGRRTPAGGPVRESIWTRIWRMLQPRQAESAGAPGSMAILVLAGRG
jgi:hypothetical protein